jgi:hypothetical protein
VNSRGAFLVSTGIEAEAAGTLRRSAHEGVEEQEAHAANHLLILEVRDLDVEEQFSRIIGAELKFIYADFEHVLHVPTAENVDALIKRWGVGSTKQENDLIVLLSIHPIALSEDAWSWLTQRALRPDHELRHVLFRLLASSDEPRFGRLLAGSGWSWEPTGDLWTNHYGTGALICAAQSLPFEQLAPKLAPWRLLEAARRLGSDAADIRLAAELLSAVVVADRLDSPDPGSEVSIDRSTGAPTSFFLSVSPKPSAMEVSDPLAALKSAFDPEASVKAHNRAAEIASERIKGTRAAGAALYLVDISVRDVELVVKHAPEVADRWLDGCSEANASFRRRVHLAEPLFLALCESLLRLEPTRGVDLWRALRGLLLTRYVGVAGVDELLHMVFRVPPSHPIEALKEELISLPWCHSDAQLYHVALAACLNGAASWLDAIVEKNSRSSHSWRRRQAVVLSGFTCNNQLPVHEAWPEGEIRTHYGQVTNDAARRRFYEACARHWWQAYLAAREPESAYAAWTLFSQAADHRASLWMQNAIRAFGEDVPMRELKLAHLELNRSGLTNSMTKRLDKLDRTFLGEGFVEYISPWLGAG